MALTVLLCALTSPVQAQTTLSGIVHDPNGRVAAGVPLVAERLVSGDVADARWETVSTDIGYYEFAKLPPGHYRITIELSPFRAVTAEVTVQTQRRAVLDIALRLGSDEQVTVEGKTTQRPLGTVELSGVATVAQFSRSELDTLLLTNGRTVQSVQGLAPGILFTDSVGSLAQFTAIGQRRFTNRMSIDGISADLAVDVRSAGIGEAGSGTLPAFATSGGTQTLVPMDAVEEIQVRTTDAAPEVARTPGAQTMIVTRAGSDRFTAAGFVSNRPNAWTASEWFASAGQAPQRGLEFWNGGASAGGPIVPGRLFYFATWEAQHANRPMTTTVKVPSAAIRASAAEAGRPWLNTFPAPNGADVGAGLAEYTGTFPLRSDLSTVSLRVDARFGASHRVFARVNRGNSEGDALPDSILQPFFSFSNREAAKALTATAGFSSLLSSTFTHDLRVNMSRNSGVLSASAAEHDGDPRSLPIEGLVPTVARDDAWVFLSAFAGASGFVLSGRTAAAAPHQVEISDIFGYTRGRHQVRFGVNYNHAWITSDGAANRFTYRFANLNDLLIGRTRTIALQHQLDTRVARHTLAAFFQDTVRVTPRLSVDVGLRYRVQPAPSSAAAVEALLLDYEALPAVQARPASSRLWETGWKNIAPHVAVTYQAGTAAGRETTVRAGWSRVFDDLASPGVSALTQGYPFVARRNLFNARLPVPDETLMGRIEPFSAGDASDYYAFPRDLRAPHTTSWQVGVEQALGSAQRVSLAYAGAAARDLIYRAVYSPGNQTANVMTYSNDARSDYHALLAEYLRRLSSGLQVRAAYTWSHAIDTDSGESPIPNPPTWLLSPELNRGAADFDRRHALQVSASYRVPTVARLPASWRALASDWQVDVVGILRSGAPINLATNGEFGGAPYTARPDVVPGQPIWVADSTSPTGQRINTAAFGNPSVTIVDRQGTLGRNALRASWLRQIDLAVSRSVRVRGMTLQLRAEAFNVFNLPNFGSLNTVVGNLGFGAPYQSYADSLGAGSLTRGGLMPIQQIGGPRSLQVSVRVGL